MLGKFAMIAIFEMTIMDSTFMLDGFLNLFSAYKYDQKAVKVELPIFENISIHDPSTSRVPRGGTKILFDPKNHVNLHKMA